jgi:hypothetical protein
MTQHPPTDEELMAYADGALDAAAMARIGRLVAADPAMQATVEMFRASRDLVREARGSLAGEPVPDQLRHSIEKMIADAGSAEPRDTVVAFRPRPGAAAPIRQRPWAMPIAASLIALAGGIAGYMAALSGANREAPQIAAVGAPLPDPVSTVLASKPSGSETATAQGRLRVIATLRSKAGEVCREFELDGSDGQTVVGIGCGAGKGWRLDIAVAAPQTQDGFAPASSLNAIDSYLDMIEASEPLTAEDEAAALSSVR